jgi:uncharacterized membrane protein YfcA
LLLSIDITTVRNTLRVWTSQWILPIPFRDLVGFVVGLTGVGGGSLITPHSGTSIGIKPAIAVATDLFYVAITKCGGIWGASSGRKRLMAQLRVVHSRLKTPITHTPISVPSTLGCSEAC